MRLSILISFRSLLFDFACCVNERDLFAREECHITFGAGNLRKKSVQISVKGPRSAARLDFSSPVLSRIADTREY